MGKYKQCHCVWRSTETNQRTRAIADWLKDNEFEKHSGLSRMFVVETSRCCFLQKKWESWTNKCKMSCAVKRLPSGNVRYSNTHAVQTSWPHANKRVRLDMSRCNSSSTSRSRYVKEVILEVPVVSIASSVIEVSTNHTNHEIFEDWAPCDAVYQTNAF